MPTFAFMLFWLIANFMFAYDPFNTWFRMDHLLLISSIVPSAVDEREVISHFALLSYVYKLFLYYIFSHFWTYSCLRVIFLSLFSFFKIVRFLLITPTSKILLSKINIKFTLTFVSLANINIISTCIKNVFTVYPPSVQNNDITRRVVMFP